MLFFCRQAAGAEKYTVIFLFSRPPASTVMFALISRKVNNSEGNNVNNEGNNNHRDADFCSLSHHCSSPSVSVVPVSCLLNVPHEKSFFKYFRLFFMIFFGISLDFFQLPFIFTDE